MRITKLYLLGVVLVLVGCSSPNPESDLHKYRLKGKVKSYHSKLFNGVSSRYFDEKGFIIGESDTTDIVSDIVFENEYNQDGFLIAQKFEFYNGIDSCRYFYNNHNVCTLRVSGNRSVEYQHLNDTLISIEYNKEKKMLIRKNYKSEGNEIEKVSRPNKPVFYKVTSNFENDLLLYKVVNHSIWNNGQDRKFIYKYLKFDSNGNWNEREVKTEEKVYVEKRVIEYY
jgi:hypothetical protein